MMNSRMKKMAKVTLKNRKSGNVLNRRRSVLFTSLNNLDEAELTHIIKYEYNFYVVTNIEFCDIENTYEYDFDKVIDVDHYGEEEDEYEDDYIDYSDPYWEMHMNGLCISDFV